jgi:hypothetical protein
MQYLTRHHQLRCLLTVRALALVFEELQWCGPQDCLLDYLGSSQSTMIDVAHPVSLISWYQDLSLHPLRYLVFVRKHLIVS